MKRKTLLGERGNPYLEAPEGATLLEQGLLAAVGAIGSSEANAPLKVNETRKARANLLPFTEATKKDYQTNWHHKVLAEYLDAVRLGEVTRLLVLMPPRHGKTELVSRRFPAHVLGKNPNEQVIGCSYSAELASSINRDVQRILTTEEYKHLFPKTRLNDTNVVSMAEGTWLRNSKVFQCVGYEGYYLAAGIGGSITGRGFTLGIVDDPIKNRDEANSKTHRDKVWNWWTSTFLTRGEGAKSPTGEERIVVTLTPWHEDDLAGRILRHAKENGEKWEVLRLPAVLDVEGDDKDLNDPRQFGEPLWPEKYGLEKLDRVKAAVGGRDWSALYQCRPSPQDGGLFNRHWWGWYPGKLPPGGLRDWTISVDAAFKDLDSSSYVVFQLWARSEKNFYLVDQVRERMDFVTTLRALVSFCNKWPVATRKLIEDKANGPAIISALKDKVPGLVAVTPKGSKESRAQAVSAFVESGNVHLPRDASWVGDYVEEFSFFPNGTHDDQVDATTQYLQQHAEDPVSFLEGLVAL